MTSRPLFISVDESTVIFGPIFQVGWRERLVDRHRRELVAAATAERPAARRQDELRDARRARGIASAQTLVDRAVLTVDRDELGARRSPRHLDHRPGGDQ